MNITNKMLSSIKKKQILVVGDLILDCHINGTISGLSAEAPIVTYKEKAKKYSLGGAANVAMNLKCANQDVSLCSVVGSDYYGEIARQHLIEEQIDESLIFIDNTRKTTVKKRYYTENNIQIFRADDEDIFDISKELEENIIVKLTEVIDRFDLIILSDYLKGYLSRNLVKSIVNIAHHYGITVLVDPKDSDFSKYEFCDILKPNKKELSMMLKKATMTEQDIIEGCKYICFQNQHSYVIVTLGAEGMMICNSKGCLLKVDAERKNIVDVCGAGDTVAAYLGTALASDMSPEDAVVLANHAAGIKVSKLGANPVALGELFISKVVSYGDLPILAKALSDKKTVFTNGCFDLLHVGHVASLAAAKDMGDVLIVAINTDESIKRLKGDTRPFVCLQNRIKMLEALSCVDYIVPFDEDTPINIIKALIPHILVKGSDYIDKEVVGADFVKAHGGELRFVDMVEGISTTIIAEGIQLKNE